MRTRCNKCVIELCYNSLSTVCVSITDPGMTLKHRDFGPLVLWSLQSEGDIEICKIHPDLNVADPLTKPLPRAKHDQHQGSMGVRIITM